MQRRHFETLRPVCPVCDAGAPLAIGSAIREEGDELVEGILLCSNESCRREYPVIDGIPILVAAIRGWLAANPLQVLQRDDLSPAIESLLGDVLGSGSAFDLQRQHTGIYAGAHYGGDALPLASLLPPQLAGPALDAGCATGGMTFRIAAQSGALTLGVDLNFAMLRIAARVRREGRVRFARRRVGLVYDRVERDVDVPARELVDFWCCDAAALPFAPQTFGTVASFNLLDCTSSPAATVAALARVLRAGGTAVLATPYDWATSATPVENWIGGHSQRGPHGGASEPLLRALLEAEGLAIVRDEEHVPWSVRLHDRSRVEYGVHAIVAKRAG